jgi:hypothetical protein
MGMGMPLRSVRHDEMPEPKSNFPAPVDNRLQSGNSGNQRLSRRAAVATVERPAMAFAYARESGRALYFIPPAAVAGLIASVSSWRNKHASRSPRSGR